MVTKSTKNSRMPSTARSKSPSTESVPLVSLSPTYQVSSKLTTKAEIARFWGWATFWFVTIGGVTALILYFADPEIIQVSVAGTEPSGQQDAIKVSMGALIMGVIALIIYIWVMMRK